MSDPYEVAARYGVRFTGELVGPEYHERVSNQWMTLRELADAGGKVTRLRLLSDPGPDGLVDISYCHGTLPDGTIVHIETDACNIGYKRTYKRALIEWCKREGVYGKGIGIFDAISMLM